jgi:hypothetical protein
VVCGWFDARYFGCIEKKEAETFTGPRNPDENIIVFNRKFGIPLEDNDHE